MGSVSSLVLKFPPFLKEECGGSLYEMEGVWVKY